jgi:hypothetical protein
MKPILALTAAAILLNSATAWAAADAISGPKATASLRGLSYASSSASADSLPSPTPPASQQLHPGELCYTHPPEDDDHVAVAQVGCTPTLLQSCLGEYQCSDSYVDAFHAGSGACGTWAVWMASEPGCDSWAYVCCLSL